MQLLTQRLGEPTPSTEELQTMRLLTPDLNVLAMARSPFGASTAPAAVHAGMLAQAGNGGLAPAPATSEASPQASPQAHPQPSQQGDDMEDLRWLVTDAMDEMEAIAQEWNPEWNPLATD